MSTIPERTLPAEIEIAIETLTNFWYSPDSFDPRGEDDPEIYVDELRQAILAALEPERALRERAERLRRAVVQALDRYRERENYEDVARAMYVDLTWDTLKTDIADNFTATSSAHEGRETE
jgi:hypothetical protein